MGIISLCYTPVSIDCCCTQCIENVSAPTICIISDTCSTAGGKIRGLADVVASNGEKDRQQFSVEHLVQSVCGGCRVNGEGELILL
jgi:hypothetical protein